VLTIVLTFVFLVVLNIQRFPEATAIRKFLPNIIVGFSGQAALLLLVLLLISAYELLEAVVKATELSRGGHGVMFRSFSPRGILSYERY
jgi:hypothetical protein